MDGLDLTPVRSIGLTGGIGSGKSTVAGFLVRAGAVLVDTDAISRQLTAAGGAAMPALRALFGSTIVGDGGALDRSRMRTIVFSDAAAKAALEGVLHPLIGAEVARQAAAAAARPVVFDVPLLTESAHWRQRVDHIVVVDCAEATQLARVMQRPGWDAAMAGNVIAQQASRQHRRAIADAVIFNDGVSRADLAAQVQRLWTLWNNPGD